jgi:hypothetical protein
MKLRTAPYIEQLPTWPPSGRHVMAQYDDSHLIVYQAFRPEIGRYAVEHQRFGGPFQMGRMTWIKPNFLWMMYRSGWGTKSDQEITLAISLKREGFDTLLSQAVASTFDPALFPNEEQWRLAVASSSVRLQWDPDHDPTGRPVGRRAIQIGMRGDAVHRYVTEWTVGIEDISAFVAEQRATLESAGVHAIEMPIECVYDVRDDKTRRRLGMAPNAGV